MAQLTHEEFLRRLETSNYAYKSGEIEILTEYTNQNVPVEVNTKYGVCLIQPYSLWKNAKPRLLSAKDKHEYFCNMLLEKRGELPDMITKYVDNETKIRISTKYGVCAMSTSSLLNNSSVGIDSAENKSEFIINRFKEVHGEEYNYDKVVYNGSTNKVTITCPVHGDFDQIVTDHLKGHGCPKCTMGEFFDKVFVSKSNEDFIADLMAKNNQYKNGEIGLLSDYEGQGIKILVKDKYGICSMWPRSLSTNKSTSIFSAVDKTAYYISKAREVHGDKYDYYNLEYKGSEYPVTVTCKIHGDFEKDPSIHLLGKGCQRCGNEKKGHSRTAWSKAAEGNPGILYILRCSDDMETFLKVGITCHTVKIRYKSGLRLPYNYEVLYSVEDMDRDKIWNLEKTLHRKIGNYKYKPNKSFDGMYECFTMDGLGLLEKHLKKEKLIL